MDRLFTVTNILLITAVSFLGVDAIYSVLAMQLDTLDGPKPVISKYKFNSVEIDVPPLSQYRSIVKRDIFQTRKPSSVANVDKIVIEDIEPTERNLKLWGTVVGKGSAVAYAIIEEPSDRSRRNRQSLHKPGDVVQGATIEKILREKVVLSADGKNEVLHLVERKSSGRSRRIRPASNQRSRQPIRRKRMLRSSQIKKAIDNMDSLQSQARIRPHSEGFQISRIRPSSIFRRMGLRNGDIITAVGGRTITSPNEALEIWRGLSSGGETSVEFNRRGRKQIIDYRIR
jgi:general secretion pathway protein C